MMSENPKETPQQKPNKGKSHDQEYIKPLVAPCRIVPYTAPFDWLRKGWSDLKQVPKLSLGYGLAMMIISMVITFLAYKTHSMVMAITLIAGFFFVGPIIAIGLYSLSRQISNNVQPLFMRSWNEGKKKLGDELVLSFMFLIIFLVWARAASMMHIFFPSTMNADEWLMFLGWGSAVGAIFASIIFSVGAFSIPMLMDRKVDSVTAAITSINAVLKNKLTMLIWGSLIMVLVFIGIVTFYIGFIVLLPLVGHATWHAYKDTIDADAWELGPGLGQEAREPNETDDSL